MRSLKVGLAILATVVFGLVAIASVVTGGLWDGYLYPRRYEAELRLAEDSSLPQQKAAHLLAFLEATDSITAQPRWVFMTPDKDLNAQRTILRGLVERLEAVAAMPPTEMAYQQGMAQVNEEMDFAVVRTAGLFKSAAFRNNPLFVVWCCSGGFWAIAAVVSGWCAFRIHFREEW